MNFSLHISKFKRYYRLLAHACPKPYFHSRATSTNNLMVYPRATFCPPSSQTITCTILNAPYFINSHSHHGLAMLMAHWLQLTHVFTILIMSLTLLNHLTVIFILFIKQSAIVHSLFWIPLSLFLKKAFLVLSLAEVSFVFRPPLTSLFYIHNQKSFFF